MALQHGFEQRCFDAVQPLTKTTLATNQNLQFGTMRCIHIILVSANQHKCRTLFNTSTYLDAIAQIVHLRCEGAHAQPHAPILELVIHRQLWDAQFLGRSRQTLLRVVPVQRHIFHLVTLLPLVLRHRCTIGFRITEQPPLARHGRDLQRLLSCVLQSCAWQHYGSWHTCCSRGNTAPSEHRWA